MAYPEWVEKQRRPGTNISCIRGKYYLYEATSVWNKEKGRAQKKTGKYLGRITEEGFIPPKAKKQSTPEVIATREYGASCVLSTLTFVFRDGTEVNWEIQNGVKPYTRKKKTSIAEPNDYEDK